MNKKITFWLLLLTVALVGMPGAQAFSSYASDLQAVYGVSACSTCHNPDFTRNAYGLLFQAQPHGANSAQNQAALRTIGAPPGVTPPVVQPPVVQPPVVQPPVLVPAPAPAPAPIPILTPDPAPATDPAPAPDNDDEEQDEDQHEDHHKQRSDSRSRD